MIDDLDLTGSVVLLIGTEFDCRRALRRYRAAGARVRRLADHELPADADPVTWRLGACFRRCRPRRHVAC